MPETDRYDLAYIDEAEVEKYGTEELASEAFRE
jgi:hypothetical protein